MSRPWPVLLMVRELGIGGCERDLAKLAKGLDRSRFEPHVGCFREEGLRSEELRRAGVPIVRFPVTSFRSPSFLKGIRAFRRYVRSNGIRLLHTFDAPTNVFGITAARISGLRPAIASQLWFLDTIQRQLWTLHRLSMKWADAVVVNSEAVGRQVVARENVSRERVFVSHNGVELNFFHPGVSKERASFADATVVIGAVCALRSEKRLDLLLDAFAKARQQFPGIKLLLVGSGPMLSALEQQRDRLSLGADCIFTPSKQDVAEWMRAMDVFVMCSESESFPNALLEAMACGCCVIGSDVGGIPELIGSKQPPGNALRDGLARTEELLRYVDQASLGCQASEESGLLFQSGNAQDLARKLIRVIGDGELRKRFAEQAAVRAREVFSMENALARMEGLYSTMLENQARGRTVAELSSSVVR